MMRIVEDSRRFVVVAAVFVVVAVAVDTAAATVVDTAVATVVDTPAVFAATVVDTAVDTAIAADTVVVVAAAVANHPKNYKIAQKSDREIHNLHDWFRTTQYAC